MDLPECPRLEIARIRSPGDFKRQLESKVLKPEFGELAETLMPVFYYSDEVFGLLDPKPSVAAVTDAKLAVASWAQTLGSMLLERSTLYNVAKHGFALQAGEGGFRLGSELAGGDPAFSFAGSSIAYLAVVGAPEDRRWAEQMSFIDPAESVACSIMACNLIEQLWTIARVRYARPENLPTICLFDFKFPEIRVARAKEHGPCVVQTMTIPLSYYADRLDADQGRAEAE
jgi:hypothetical protein